MSEIKQAIFEKIRQYEAYKIDPKHQTEMEQNAIAVVLRELQYLDQIAEYDLKEQNTQMRLGAEFIMPSKFKRN